MTTIRQTDTSSAPPVQGSRAINQQHAIEERFKEFLGGKRLLNIGSGQAPMIGWENVDLNPKSPAMHHFDLLSEWPLEDDTYDAVAAIHVLEHFTGQELFKIIWEAGRVLKVGGALLVVVPYGLHAYHYCNPFHKQAWTEGTPLQFNRAIYEMENMQSTGADQGERMHVWCVSNMTFVPDHEWIDKPSEVIQSAMRRYLNVVLEMSFAMILGEK